MQNSEKDPQYDKEAYELRYAKVYEAGALFWEDPLATEELMEFVQKMEFPKGLHVIEFGCGEGRDAINLAKIGFRVTAIDIAPSAIKRAKKWARDESVEINFRVGDVISLERFSDSSFDLAVNIGCLHMIVDEGDRMKHLKEALRILKPSGVYFSCNLGGDKPMRKEDLKEARPRPGTLTPREIKVDGQVKKIMLPIISAWPKSGRQYSEEFENAGYKVAKIFQRNTRALGSCWILIAKKATIAKRGK